MDPTKKRLAIPRQVGPRKGKLQSATVLTAVSGSRPTARTVNYQASIVGS